MIRYALLGLIQGITEFLPVSSSGHLVLAGKWLGVHSPGVLLEAMLHWGTLLAVLVAFRTDLLTIARAMGGRGRIEDRKRVGFLIAGTLPIVAVGLLLRDAIEHAFSSIAVVGVSLLVTGGLLFATRVFRSRARRPELRFSDALWVGLAQATSVIPGISRSGSTLATGMMSGLTPERAVRFSFLLSIPALFGAGLLHLVDAVRTPQQYNWMGIAVGTVVAFLVGRVCIRVLMELVRRRLLWCFGIYCLLLGLGTLGWLLFG